MYKIINMKNIFLSNIQELAATATDIETFSWGSGRRNDDVNFEGGHINTFLEVVHEQVIFPAKI